MFKQMNIRLSSFIPACRNQLFIYISSKVNVFESFTSEWKGEGGGGELKPPAPPSLHSLSVYKGRLLTIN